MDDDLFVNFLLGLAAICLIAILVLAVIWAFSAAGPKTAGGVLTVIILAPAVGKLMNKAM